MKLVIRTNDEYCSFLRGFGKKKDQIELTVDRGEALIFKNETDAREGIRRLAMLSNGVLSGTIEDIKNCPKRISI